MIAWENSKVITTNNRYGQRLCLEAWHINMSNHYFVCVGVTYSGEYDVCDVHPVWMHTQSNIANIMSNHALNRDDGAQALKYRSVTDIVRPIREIVRRSEETTGHSVRPK